MTFGPWPLTIPNIIRAVTCSMIELLPVFLRVDISPALCLKNLLIAVYWLPKTNCLIIRYE
jgi:hypothetical protein